MALELHHIAVRENLVPILYFLKQTKKRVKLVKHNSLGAFKTHIESLPASSRPLMASPPFLKQGKKAINSCFGIMILIAKHEELAQYIPEMTQFTSFLMMKNTLVSMSNAVVDVVHNSEDREDMIERYQDWLGRDLIKLEGINGLLEEKKWILGDNLSVLDFYLAEFLEKVLKMERDFNLDIITQFGHFSAYLSRVFKLEGIAEARNEEGFEEMPFFEPSLSLWN